jgi:hypothetical protein
VRPRLKRNVRAAMPGLAHEITSGSAPDRFPRRMLRSRASPPQFKIHKRSFAWSAFSHAALVARLAMSLAVAPEQRERVAVLRMWRMLSPKTQTNLKNAAATALNWLKKICSTAVRSSISTTLSRHSLELRGHFVTLEEIKLETAARAYIRDMPGKPDRKAKTSTGSKPSKKPQGNSRRNFCRPAFQKADWQSSRQTPARCQRYLWS